MESMANNVLYCQKCATPHEANYPWLFWLGFRLDSSQCKDRLICSNADILKLEILAEEENGKIAEDLRSNKFVSYNRKNIKTTQFRSYQKKITTCPICSEIIHRTRRRCPYCCNYTGVDYRALDYPTKNRNQEIVELLNKGIYTLQEVGKRFGVSRERIRQLYKKMTGKPYDFRQGSVNIARLLNEWEKKQVKPTPRPSLGIYDAFFFRYRKLDQIALT